MRIIGSVFLGLFFITGLATADTVEATLTFSQNDFNFTQITYDNVTYDYVTVKADVATLNVPGQPQVPLLLKSFSIPFGSTVTAVEVISSTTQDLGEYYLYPGQKPRISGEGDGYNPDDWEFTPPDEETYNSQSFLPEANVVDRGAAPSRGYLTSDFVVYPLRWKPKTGVLRLYTSMTVRVTYTPPLSAPEATRYEWPDVYDAWGEGVKARVLNADDVVDNREPVIPVDVMEWGEDEEDGDVIPWVKPHTSSYYEYNVPQAVDGFPGVADPCYPFKYMVITNEKWWTDGSNYISQGDMESALAPLREWRMRSGTGMHIVMVDDIVNSDVTGVDKQEKIRNWMKACYTNWGTQAFFLVGDTAALPTGDGYPQYWNIAGRYGVVPSRYLAATVPDERYRYECPSDLYYTILNGNWSLSYNEEGQYNVGYWGVGNNHPPFYADVWVGRLPAGSTTTGAGDDEVTAYVNKLLTYEIDPPIGYLDKALLIGADFGSVSGRLMEPHLATFSKTTLYEDEMSRYPLSPEPHQVYDAVSAGAGLTFFATHGHPWYNYILTHGINGDQGTPIEEFTVAQDFPAVSAFDTVFAHGWRNVDVNDKYGILLSHACSTFRYNYSDLDKEECVGTVYLDAADGGGVAYVGNTTLGLMYTDSLFHSWVDYLLGTGNNAIGETTAEARCSYLRQFGTQHAPYTLNLGGDPKMPVWTAEPGELSLTYDVYTEGLTKTIEVTVRDGNDQPVNGAYVCFYQNFYYLTGSTKEPGVIRFKGITDTFNDGKLTATKHNYRPALVNNVTVGGG